jgi:hypothetical protein
MFKIVDNYGQRMMTLGHHNKLTFESFYSDELKRVITWHKIILELSAIWNWHPIMTINKYTNYEVNTFYSF